jgi:glutaredoxin
VNPTKVMNRIFWVCLLSVITTGFALVGCKGNSSSNRSSSNNSATAGLPPLVLRDDTTDLLLTWVDSSGDFHVVQKLNEVPEDARERVRVVVTTKDEGNADPVYVADLRQKGADQAYSVTTMARSSWEELGAAKRKARLETLAPVASAEGPAAGTPRAADATAKTVTIYGAKWCGACRQAKAYLTQKGVKFLEKDVDESPTVQAELRAKLSKAGMPPTSSIPILDVGGKLLVGFSQGAIDAALQAMRP